MSTEGWREVSAHTYMAHPGPKTAVMEDDGYTRYWVAHETVDVA